MLCFVLKNRDWNLNKNIHEVVSFFYAMFRVKKSRLKYKYSPRCKLSLCYVLCLKNQDWNTNIHEVVSFFYVMSWCCKIEIEIKI